MRSNQPIFFEFMAEVFVERLVFLERRLVHRLRAGILVEQCESNAQFAEIASDRYATLNSCGTGLFSSVSNS